MPGSNQTLGGSILPSYYQRQFPMSLHAALKDDHPELYNIYKSDVVEPGRVLRIGVRLLHGALHHLARRNHDKDLRLSKDDYTKYDHEKMRKLLEARVIRHIQYCRALALGKMINRPEDVEPEIEKLMPIMYMDAFEKKLKALDDEWSEYEDEKNASQTPGSSEFKEWHRELVKHSRALHHNPLSSDTLEPEELAKISDKHKPKVRQVLPRPHASGDNH